MCDCIVFMEGRNLAVIELKTTPYHVGEIEAQLANGILKALDIAGKDGKKYDVFPILVSKNNPSSIVRNKLDQSKIITRDGEYDLIRRTCKRLGDDFLVNLVRSRTGRKK